MVGSFFLGSFGQRLTTSTVPWALGSVRQGRRSAYCFETGALRANANDARGAAKEAQMDLIARQVLSSVVFIAISSVIGCAHESPPAVSARPPVMAQPTPNAVVVVPSASADINVSEEILRMCNIDFNNVATAPKFDFDNSDLRSDERALLEKVVTCVTTGPLKGRSLHLIGRADPRGDVQYNHLLGESRAGSVRSYLIGLNLDAARVTTTSRGKLDATGTDEVGWQRDRRVDIELM